MYRVLYMLELLRVTEGPRECSYLPEETASLEYRFIAEMSPEEASELLARGYRRFGWQVFRPACGSCAKCLSIRVLAREFSPSATERRILRKNESIRAELHPLFMTREHIQLYNAYHAFMNRHRAWTNRATTPASYREEFLSGASGAGRQWLYFDGDRLVGVALMDEVRDAISLVYFFYDPGWRARSPGTYSVLNQLLYAKSKGLRYAYLGYWIKSCQSMAYKGRFQPHEILEEYPADGVEPVWTRSSTAASTGL